MKLFIIYFQKIVLLLRTFLLVSLQVLSFPCSRWKGHSKVVLKVNNQPSCFLHGICHSRSVMSQTLVILWF